MVINKPGLMACAKAPQVLTNQIACEINSNPGFKCWKTMDSEMALLVYKRWYSFTIGVTILI
ncbi:hypothetical protein TE10_05035 [Raoultella ornithinolytica]|nr:hypothetical protein TE10_05035 [Raoultella ornithinolytica]OMP92051.1 hypothetical protein BZP36_18035 [Raoultella terrigena]